MKLRQYVWFVAVLLCASISVAETGTATKQKLGRSMLIDAEQLHEQLNDKKVRVIDARSADDYAKGHVPGALRVDVAEWKNFAVAGDGFRDANGWAKKLQPLGLQNDTHVVVYGSKLSDAARIWWLLKYVGVKDVSMLNGGWDWWTKNTLPTQTSISEVAATDFQPDFQSDRLAEIKSVKESLKDDSLKLVDTRSSDEFAGGHIPGSTLLEWKELMASDGRFKTKTQLQELFREREILPTETAVCY